MNVMVLVNDNSKVLKIGDAMPHFRLPSAQGSTIDSTEFQHRVLVVIFTCNHCPYAQAYDDRLVTLAEKLRDLDVQFVLINSNDASNYPEDDFAHMQLKAKEKNYPFPYCHDEEQSTARAYGALCTPHCFVFGSERTLMYKGRIDDNWQHPKQVSEHNLADACTALAENNDLPVQEANALGCSIKWKEKAKIG